MERYRRLLGSIRQRSFERPGATTFLWFAADRGVRMMVALFVGGWTARYLGTGNFGLLNYTVALIAVFAAVVPLGMEGLAVREMIREPETIGQWVGTVVGFRGIASVLCAGLAMATVALLRPGENLPLVMVTVLTTGLIAQSLESGELLFQARGCLNRLIVPRLVLFLCLTPVKVAAILCGLPLIWFVVLTALEQIASGLITWHLVRRELGDVHPLRFIPSRGWQLVATSWPMAVSALAVMLYLKLSQFLLSRMLDDNALGLYSAAIRFSEAAGFVPIALATSLLPGLMKNHEQGQHEYSRALLRYFRLNACISYLLSLTLCVAAPWLINRLFGAEYASSAPAMMVHVWSLVFVFLGVARTQHLLTKRQTGHSLIFNLIGLTMSIGLNLLFIPRWGINGAAAATVLSYGLANVFASFVFPDTRHIGLMQLHALVTPWHALDKR